MNAGPLLAIIEDDPVLGRSLQQRFQLEGYRVELLTSVAEAERALAHRPPHIVLSDIRLPDGTGEALMMRIFEAHGILPTIFMTAFGDIAQAVRLVKGGARDYITKPFDLDQLVSQIESIIPSYGKDRQLPVDDPFASFGLSPSTSELRRTLEKIADFDVSVLFQGETGTGKDMAARFLHNCGSRAGKPFVAVNCASIPDTLFEATFFGHEKGAFASAVAHVPGLVEQAADGTLFLDEIGELDPASQVRLLRLIETREFGRIGGSSPITSQARFVFATNRKLDLEVAEGRFREDLWFRINVVTCAIPALRERAEEIVPLIRYHTELAAARMGRPMPAIDNALLEMAEHQAWRGNVRELINRVERAVALGEGGMLRSRDFWPEQAREWDAAENDADDATLANIRAKAERSHIERTLKATEGRVQDAAKRLGVSRTTLWDRMRRYKLEWAASRKDRAPQ